MTEHTPAPWVASGEYVYSKSNCIAICDTDLFSRRVNDANARLMAAAPELLAEMKSLYRAYVSLLETGRDRIVSTGGDCDPVDVMEEGSPPLRAARALIAKAEGRL